MEESSQSNLVAGRPEGAATGPLREARRKGTFASCNIYASGMEVLPVPPVRRIAIFGN